MERIARFLVTRSQVVLGLTAVISLGAALMLFRMSFNPDVTAFLSESSDEGRDFVALQEKYESSDPVTVMVERKDGGSMIEREGLELLMEVKARLQQVEGVQGVGTLIPDENPMTGEPFTRETLDDMPDGMLPYLTNSPVASMVVSENKKAVLAMVDPGEHPVVVGRALQKAAMPDGAEVTLAGNPIIFAQVLDDLSWFLLVIPPCVIGLLLLVFGLNIGSRKLAALAILPAGLGSLWTFGLIFALGHRVDIVTIIVPIWVIVMGSADGLHFVTHLQEAAQRSDDRVEQTRSALHEVGIPMILTTLSTAAGFLSMLATGIGPMEQLGLFTAAGITFAGVISFFFLPALLSRVTIEPPHGHALGQRLTGLFAAATRKRVWALLVFLGCAAFSAAYLPKLDVNSDQLFFFPDDHPVRLAFEKMRETFGGATPLFGEVAWDPKGDRDQQLAELNKTLGALEALASVREVVSPATLLESAPPGMADKVLSGEQATPMGKMVSDDGMRFVVFPTRVTAEAMDAWRTFKAEHDDVRVLTGQPLLFDAMSRLVMRAQLSSLGLALVLVALMLLAVYRKVGQTVVALVPMAATIAVLLAFYAASGIQLHLLSAVVSSIVIGVGIDYVIHLIAAIELRREAGPGFAARAIRAVGRPILANALGIAVGLSALFLSPLKPHGQIALIMWVAMITGAVTTLLFVPALVSGGTSQETAS